MCSFACYVEFRLRPNKKVHAKKSTCDPGTMDTMRAIFIKRQFFTPVKFSWPRFSSFFIVSIWFIWITFCFAVFLGTWVMVCSGLLHLSVAKSKIVVVMLLGVAEPAWHKIEKGAVLEVRNRQPWTPHWSDIDIWHWNGQKVQNHIILGHF